MCTNNKPIAINAINAVGFIKYATYAIIENNQAIEMSDLYRGILSSTTDTVATIISNNLNTIMKFLAGITIVFSIPTMVASFMGMNVTFGKFADNP